MIFSKKTYYHNHFKTDQIILNKIKKIENVLVKVLDSFISLIIFKVFLFSLYQNVISTKPNNKYNNNNNNSNNTPISLLSLVWEVVWSVEKRLELV
jgi:hypothetical protein